MDRYIKLITEEPLDRPEIKAWFNSVIEHAPSGIVHAVTVEDDDKERHVVRLIHQVMNGKHAYVVPITRDLSEGEVDAIVEQFAERVPELDFDVETNETRLRAKDERAIPVDDATHLALCLALAKHKHESWVRERTGSGWRYGMQFDSDEKTHPLLRPWDQLPERYKTPDLQWPQALVNMLNDNGYMIMHRDDIQQLAHPSPRARR